MILLFYDTRFHFKLSDESGWVWPGSPICMHGRVCIRSAELCCCFNTDPASDTKERQSCELSDLYLLIMHSDTRWYLEADKTCYYTKGVRGHKRQNAHLSHVPGSKMYLVSSCVLTWTSHVTSDIHSICPSMCKKNTCSRLVLVAVKVATLSRNSILCLFQNTHKKNPVLISGGV